MENRRSCIDALAMKRHPAKHWRAGALSVTFCAVAASAMATVSYTYENDGKTYVAEVTDAETAISDEAIAILNANEVTNFVVRGSARFLVNKGSTFTGDVHATTSMRLSAVNALGVGPGKIYVKESKFVMSGGTIVKEVDFDCGTGWNNNTTIAVWGGYGTSTFEKAVTYSDRNLTINPYTNSCVVFKGGIVGPGTVPVRDCGGGTVVFTNMPISLGSGYPLSFYEQHNFDTSGFASHFIFAVAGNSLKRYGHTTYRPVFHELKTTVDWAFDNANMVMHFGHDSKWDFCGTSQRIGYLDATCDSGNPPVITNSLEAPAMLYVTQTANATPAAIFGGNLSVDFSGNKITTIDYANTAKGGITVNAGTLAFTENGSWANATNVTVKGSAKITVASAGALGRKANVNLASASSLNIAQDVTVQVRTLTVGGVQQRRGDYTFGSGTLHVSHPCGFILSVH